MFTAPASPEESRQIRDLVSRYRINFIIAAVLTCGFSLGMLVSGMLLPAIIFAGIGAYGSMLLFGRMKAFSAELMDATIMVFIGPIEKKELAVAYLAIKERLIFVDGENHRVPSVFFSGVDEGDTVELHFTHYVRHLTFARLLHRKGAQVTVSTPSVQVQEAFASAHPDMVLYAQPADLGGYDRQHDAFSPNSATFQGTLSPGVSYDDPTVAVRLCLTCRFPLDAATGNCAQCNPPKA
ncbi:hypothetical protein KKF84_11880 [Myxococcota bacterium]|nr:hypothetical protein [Myxococcota bacterium]MBU1536013.1 hypothetical protein [Myxococcota bacterium]